MFWAVILPIFSSARLCVSACGIMHPRCCRPVAWKQSSPLPGYRLATSGCIISQAETRSLGAPEDGQNNCLKHVELIGIINKLLSLHLVGVYIIYILFI